MGLVTLIKIKLTYLSFHVTMAESNLLTMLVPLANQLYVTTVNSIHYILN